MKINKKISLLLVLVLSLTILSSCKKEDTPTSVLNKFLVQYKSGNYEEAKKYVKRPSQDFDNNPYEVDDPTFEEIKDLIMEKARDIELISSEEKIENEKATVNGKFKIYDFSSSIKQTIASAMAQVFTEALSGKDEDEIEKGVSEKIKEAFTDAQKIEKDAVINFEKIDGNWKIVNDEEDGRDFFNNISGNLVEIENYFSN